MKKRELVGHGFGRCTLLGQTNILERGERQFMKKICSQRMSLILLLIGLMEGAEEKCQQSLGPYAESIKKTSYRTLKFWTFESGQNDIEGYFGSTNQTLQSYTVRMYCVCRIGRWAKISSHRDRTQ